MDFHKCPKQNCNVQTDGKCLEGHEISDCPFYDSYSESDDDLEHSDNNDQDDESVNDDTESDIPKDTYIQIHNANALNIDECENFMRENETNLITLAGKVYCGKTTIIATLIQLFQQNDSFADFLFAGSRSLIGFEQRCHPSRFESGASEEQTNRTSTFDIDEYSATKTFLQLTLKKGGKYYHFLIADIAGEVFDTLITSTEMSQKLTFLKRCDSFSLIFDMEALIDYTKRASAKTDTISILRSLIDANMISTSATIQILFTKWDLVSALENQEPIQTYIEKLQGSILKEFSGNYPNIVFIEIACRPKVKDSYSIGYGLEKLLISWTENSISRKTPENIIHERSENARQFLNFKYES